MFPPSVIIRNLHVVSVSVAPYKTNTPLVVDAYAVLPRTVTFQLMKSVTRRHSQIRQTFGRVQHQKLSSRWLANVHELTNILIVEKPLRVGALEGPYHIQRV
ncbi:MAG TPA: hypothetical protein VFQ43_20650 [Nitrososphaera sp.]|nr:hypothetical protein [Nitrososphaera sp.]